MEWRVDNEKEGRRKEYYFVMDGWMDGLTVRCLVLLAFAVRSCSHLWQMADEGEERGEYVRLHSTKSAGHTYGEMRLDTYGTMYLY